MNTNPGLRDMYPNGFLQETEQTLRLLFPTEELKSSKRVRRIAEKQSVDIEAQIEYHENFQLTNYPFYGERLEEIQRRYDITKPTSLKQWWFDRREKSEWVTLWIAVLVFVLTIFFGVISSVTGILQAYASWKALGW